MAKSGPSVGLCTCDMCEVKWSDWLHSCRASWCSFTQRKRWALSSCCGRHRTMLHSRCDFKASLSPLHDSQTCRDSVSREQALLPPKGCTAHTPTDSRTGQLSVRAFGCSPVQAQPVTTSLITLLLLPSHYSDPPPPHGCIYKDVFLLNVTAFYVDDTFLCE